MKCFVLILFFGLQFIPALIAEAVSDQRIAEFISSSKVADDGGLSFDPSLNLTSVEVDSFKEWFRQADDPVEKIRPLVIDDQKRGVALHFAAASLDDDHFYRVSLNTLRKFASGEIREKELYFALSPPEEKRGILAINFRDQNLASALRGCLGRGLTKPAYVQIIESILSGDAARDVFRKAGENYPERYGPLAKQALENIPGGIWPWIAGALMLIPGALVLLKRRS